MYYPFNINSVRVFSLQAESAFAADGRDLQTRLRDSELVTSDIRGFTGPRTGASLLPADLNTTNLILSGIVGLLEESLSTTENITDEVSIRLKLPLVSIHIESCM